MIPQDPASMTSRALARACEENTELFLHRQQSDSRYCYELFRRALSQGDQDAWDMVYHQYSPMVLRWVKRHPSLRATAEEPQYFVNRAFERLWTAVSPEFPFQRLPQILTYLQMCVHSVIVDHARAAELCTIHAQTDGELALEQGVGSVADASSVALEASDFWRLIVVRLNSEQERAVIHGSYVMGLKPRELVARLPAMFSDVRQVYRIKENVLARLRRDRELENLLANA